MSDGRWLGVDIGTGSSKGVIVDSDGRILAQADRKHDVDRPAPGYAEMPLETWWREFVELSRELLESSPGPIDGVGVSGMGPVVGLLDEHDTPVRSAILYGVDTRAVEQIAHQRGQLGEAAVLERCGSALSTQAVGPKVQWIAEHEPDAMRRARRLVMASSWLVLRLTGEYVLDHHSASQAVPLYDTDAEQWALDWAELLAPGIRLPRLLWSGEPAGSVTASAAAATGIAVGTPVVCGSVDAWAEAHSAHALDVGDLMLMYGSTMFLIATTGERITVPELWSTQGLAPSLRCLAGGMAASGAITDWLRRLTGIDDFAELSRLAAAAGPGARGLLVLPYFAGERTPIADPHARGVIAGLRLDTEIGDLHRAVLESIAFGVRHNIEVLEHAGAECSRITAVGGGTTGQLWTSIVSDVTGRAQRVPTLTIGASLGAARLAAAGSGADTSQWNRGGDLIEPDPALRNLYDDRYALYRTLYTQTAPVVHSLAGIAPADARRITDAPHASAR